MIFQEQITIDTDGRGTIEITPVIQKLVLSSGIRTGICHIFIMHTSASLTLCENADPDVRRDLETFMSRLVPDGASSFTHVTEGPDDMPAHVRTVLTDSALSCPVKDGHCALGTWQGIYLWEHRTAPHSRKLLITLYGEQ